MSGNLIQDLSHLVDSQRTTIDNANGGSFRVARVYNKALTASATITG